MKKMMTLGVGSCLLQGSGKAETHRRREGPVGKDIQAEGTANAKALRQEEAGWHPGGAESSVA